MTIPEAPVDWGALLEAADGDEAFICELLDTFTVSCDDALTTLKAARDCGDWKAVRGAAHALKGASANMRAAGAAAAAAALEAIDGAEDHSKLSSSIDKLETAIHSAIRYLNVRCGRG